MRPIVVAAVVALVAAASAFAAPAQTHRYIGWRYGPISGAATYTTSVPRLSCFAGAWDDRRVVRGVYRTTFVGRSMRRLPAGPDVDYSLRTTAGIELRLRRSFDETIHVRTITVNEQGERVCSLSEESCLGSSTKIVRSRFNGLWIEHYGRALYFHFHFGPERFGVGLANCAGLPSRALFILSKDGPEKSHIRELNRPRTTVKLTRSGAASREVDGGVVDVGLYTFRVAIDLVRMPGTPPVRCSEPDPNRGRVC